MIVVELTEIINEEIIVLKKILDILDEQYKHIMEKNIFELDAIVDKMKLANKELAEKEVARRRFLGDKSMKEILRNSKYEQLDKSYREINILLQTVNLQKDTNELLIRQQMGFNNQILNILNPRREVKTYNSYGSLRK
jgi:flagellar biosynthesis/type III secretory pathway chaperone